MEIKTSPEDMGPKREPGCGAQVAGKERMNKVKEEVATGLRLIRKQLLPGVGGGNRANSNGPGTGPITAVRESWDATPWFENDKEKKVKRTSELFFGA